MSHHWDELLDSLDARLDETDDAIEAVKDAIEAVEAIEDFEGTLGNAEVGRAELYLQKVVDLLERAKDKADAPRRNWETNAENDPDNV